LTGFTDLGELEPSSAGVLLGGGPFLLDPRTNRQGPPFARLDVTDIGVGAGSLWVSDFSHNLVRRFDLRSRHLEATIALKQDDAPEDIVVDGDSAWVALHHGGGVARISVATNKVTQRIALTQVGAPGAQFETAAFSSVWVGVPSESEVVRISRRTGRVTARIPIIRMSPCGGFASTATSLWVSQCLDDPGLARIDPRTEKQTAFIDPGGLVLWMTAVGDSVWYVVGGDPADDPTPGYLVEMNDQGVVERGYSLGDGFTPGGIVVAFGSLWVASSNGTRGVLRIPLAALQTGR
jgi:hypothetical protein